MKNALRIQTRGAVDAEARSRRYLAANTPATTSVVEEILRVIWIVLSLIGKMLWGVVKFFFTCLWDLLWIFWW